MLVRARSGRPAQQAAPDAVGCAQLASVHLVGQRPRLREYEHRDAVVDRPGDQEVEVAGPALPWVPDV